MIGTVLFSCLLLPLKIEQSAGIIAQKRRERYSRIHQSSAGETSLFHTRIF